MADSQEEALFEVLFESDLPLRRKVTVLARLAQGMADNAQDANMEEWADKCVSLAHSLKQLATDLPSRDPQER